MTDLGLIQLEKKTVVHVTEIRAIDISRNVKFDDSFDPKVHWKKTFV